MSVQVAALGEASGEPSSPAQPTAGSTDATLALEAEEECCQRALSEALDAGNTDATSTARAGRASVRLRLWKQRREEGTMGEDFGLQLLQGVMADTTKALHDVEAPEPRADLLLLRADAQMLLSAIAPTRAAAARRRGIAQADCTAARELAASEVRLRSVVARADALSIALAQIESDESAA